MDSCLTLDIPRAEPSPFVWRTLEKCRDEIRNYVALMEYPWRGPCVMSDRFITYSRSSIYRYMFKAPSPKSRHNFQPWTDILSPQDLRKAPAYPVNRTQYLPTAFELMAFLGDLRCMASFVALTLILLCVLAGGQPGFLPGSEIVTVGQSLKLLRI